MTGPPILAPISEPDSWKTVPGKSHFELVNAHLSPGTMLLVDLARSPLSANGLSFEQADGRLVVKYGDQPIDPGAVWWWPAIPQVEDRMLHAALSSVMAPGLVATLGDVAHRTVKQHLRALRTAFPGSRYVNPPEAIERTGDRPYHLALAARLGFNVLKTLQSDDPSQARRWVRARFADRERVLWKSPEHVFFDVNDGDGRTVERRKFGVPTELRQADESNWAYESVRVTPRIFQVLIDGPDVRVTVVGRRVFAVKLTPRGELGKVRDVRAYRPIYQRFEDLTGGQQQMCRRLVRALGLLHAELDFKLMPDGRLVLLELQGDGAWADTELETGQHVGEAFAQLLTRTAARHR